MFTLKRLVSSGTGMDLRAQEISLNIANIKNAMTRALTESGRTSPFPTLVAVSKLKPPIDIAYCYNTTEQRDFGENYAQECMEKAKEVLIF